MAKTRDPWLDNTKMVLVTIVVIGHMIVLMPGGEVKSRIYDFIYLFHIPAFVLITGYLSKSFAYTRRHLVSVLTTLVLPYVVFSWVMVQFRHHVGDEPLLPDIWTDPHWPMWYLIVLVWWRLLTPILKLHWVMVPISIAVSLVGGLSNHELFDFNRTMGMLPFFVIGLHLSPAGLKVLRRRGAWLIGLVVLAGLWWLAARTDVYWSTQFFYFRAPYSELGFSDSEGIWIRARLLVIALVGALGVLTLVPHRRSFITSMGLYSLVAYLCHGFVVRYLEYRGFEDWLPGNGWGSAIITIAVGLVIALVVASAPVAKLLSWPVDPVNTWQKSRAKAKVS